MRVAPGQTSIVRYEQHPEKDVDILFQFSSIDSKTVTFRGQGYDGKTGWPFSLAATLNTDTFTFRGRKIYEMPIEESHLTESLMRRQAIEACMRSSDIRRPWSLGVAPGRTSPECMFSLLHRFAPGSLVSDMWHMLQPLPSRLCSPMFRKLPTKLNGWWCCPECRGYFAFWYDSKMDFANKDGLKTHQQQQLVDAILSQEKAGQIEMGKPCLAPWGKKSKKNKQQKYSVFVPLDVVLPQNRDFTQTKSENERPMARRQQGSSVEHFP